MTDIFAILGQAAAPGNPLAPIPGTSIEDLEKHLRDLLASKVLPERAECLSFNYEISSGARLTVSLSQAESDVLDGLGGIDPVLGGARSSEAPDSPQLERVIPMYDTIMNQPQDNPTPQKMVARHIIGAVGACDGSSWVAREDSRGPQGWSFTYMCKDSMQSWRRLNMKSMQNVVVGDYTEKEMDPVSSSRPAFDCGGTVVVSFSRGSKNITVKYRHTPFHKTVAELYEHFAPPPPPVPHVNTATPKLAKSGRKRDVQNGEGSSRKRSRKGVVGGDPAEAAPTADGVVVVDGQAAADTNQPDGAPQQNPKRKYQYKRKKEPAVGSGQQGGSAQAAEGEDGDATARLNSIVGINAEEASRRREKATEMLSSAGVGPQTLSADQFNIFANQSPELQQESLAMLVQYGAERLRIVHPNKDTSAENKEQDQGGAGAPASTQEASTATEPTASTAKEITNATAPRPKKQRVSRGSCSNCREKKGVKCGREKPACQNCVDAGIDCSYPLQKSRPKKPNSGAEVEDEPDESTMMDTQPDGDTTQLSLGNQTMNSVDLPTMDDQLRPYPSVNNHQTPQFDGQGDSLHEASMEHQGYDVAQPILEQSYHQPEPAQPEPNREPEQEPQSEMDREQETAPRSQSRPMSRGNRHSLPLSRGSQESNEYPPVAVTQSPETPSWAAVNSSSLAASQPQARHATIVQSPPAAPTAQMSPQAYQGAVLQSTEGPQAKAVSIENQAGRSPYQAAAAASNLRTSSCQGHRGQSWTPMQDATTLHPPVAPAPHTQPPVRQSSASAQQLLPASNMSYQNPPNVSNVPASSAPDEATYKSASSVSGLGNYEFGSFSSQNEGGPGVARISYEPYSSHPAAGNQSYTAYDDSFSRSNPADVKLPTASTQTNTSGYAASPSMSPSRWPSQGTSLPGATPPTPSSHTPPLNAQPQSHNLQTHFNRNATPPKNDTYSNSANAYTQKQQPQPQTQAPAYNPQQSPSRAGQQHQERPQQNHHQHNRYGLDNPGAGSDYRRGGELVSGPYAEQEDIGLGGYSGDGDLIGLLGSVHHGS